MTSGRVLACCRRTESREAREGRAVAGWELVAGEGEHGSRRGFSGGCSSPVAGGRRVGGRGESRAEEAASRMGARAVVREGRAGRMGTQWISA